MNIPWSQFEQPRDDSALPFVNKQAWAEARETFLVIGISGPTKGRFGDQWLLTVERERDGLEFTLGYGSNPTRDPAMLRLAETLSKMTEGGVGPCILREMPSSDPTRQPFYLIVDAEPRPVASNGPMGDEPPPLDDLPF